ncbi:MAG: 16S rRNA (adenine(1518)-N(6)/adenine(1519)-N(6))-dimethyltransferase RsmA [Actinobacteria bacterium]|nr:MAG: 16S rRNA (adenine(1518)-N(6)/adenine(1519)-N(6))-dimethyltransferase RsmA [Actinomycetota bacterium]
MEMVTAATLRTLLDEHGLRANKALGQHFLADPNTARRIARLAEIGPGDRVLEIGPGLGSLTLALVETGAHVLALELDRRIAAVLKEVVRDALALANDGDLDASGVAVVVGDALELDIDSLLVEADPQAREWVSVSNLPYNVAAPIVIRVLEAVPRITRLLVMVQREVAERLVAAPGTRAASAVSAKVAYYASARIVGAVSPAVFVPKPRVDSALVRFDRRATPPVVVPSSDALFDLVRAGFAQRRKMLRRSLRPVLGERTDVVLEDAGVAPTARAETLTLDDWAALARTAA